MSATTALFGSSWFLIAAMLAVFSDAFIPLVPSASVVVAALETSEGRTSPVLLGLGVAIASFASDLLLIRVARHGASWAQRRLDRKPGAASAAAHLLEALETKGGRTIVVARFVPGGRTVLDLAVGISGRPPKRFRRWSATSAAVWATYIIGLGYLNESTFDSGWLSFAVSSLATTTISAVIARMVQRQRRLARENSEAVAAAAAAEAVEAAAVQVA